MGLEFSPIRIGLVIIGSLIVILIWLLWPASKKGDKGQQKDTDINEPGIAEPLQPGELMDTDTGVIYSNQLDMETDRECNAIRHEIERMQKAFGKLHPPTTKSEQKQRLIILDSMKNMLPILSKLCVRSLKSEFAEYQATGFGPRAGHVYVLTNKAYPDMVKIGMTTRPVSQRVRELQSTGVPYPFEIAHSVRVPDCAIAERLIHAELQEHRVNTGREFFSLPVSEAIAAVNDALAR